MVFSASLSVERSAYVIEHSLVPSVCPHVSSGDTGDWIWMPFAVVSEVGLSMGVWDFGGDRRREMGNLGDEYNAEMAYWSIIDSCVKS